MVKAAEGGLLERWGLIGEVGAYWRGGGAYWRGGCLSERGAFLTWFVNVDRKQSERRMQRFLN